MRQGGTANRWFRLFGVKLVLFRISGFVYNSDRWIARYKGVLMPRAEKAK